MTSFISSILHTSANKIESISKNYRLNHDANTEFIPSPPPYDSMQQSVITPTPSNSMTLSDLMEKTNKNNVDRHCISQGIKLVSIAADEYEDGNESIALDIYLTGVDKILMALPNKTDINTKMTIKEKLIKVEERVGITHDEKKKIQPQEDNNAAIVQSFLLSRLTSTISSISTKAVKSVNDAADQQVPSMECAAYDQNKDADSMTRFKQFGQYMIQVIVTLAILIKQSPLPDLVSFIFGYLFQLFLWIDAHYHVKEKVQDFSIYCIKYGIAADEKYHLHEYITEGIYMMIVAGLKAVVAFKETPRYKECNQENKMDEAIDNQKSNRVYVNNSIIVQPQVIHQESPLPVQKPKAPKSWKLW